MLDIFAESLLPLSQAPSLLPGRVHRSTLERWRMRGRRGVKLETVLVGGIRYTSKEALSRFVNGVTAAADGAETVGGPGPAETNAERERAIQRAERYLEAEGV